MISKTFFSVGVIVVMVFAGVGMGLFFIASSLEEDGVFSDMKEGGFYITTMTHMEGNFRDDQNEALFLRHVDQVRWAMDLFDEYGAKVTIESEQSFAKANTLWGVNILREVVERGHGVGTHADFGAGVSDADITLAELTAHFVENKRLVDDLVGSQHNRGVSGGTSYADWVLAASGAGFQYMDGVTGFGYLSMPLSARPDGWTDEYIRSTAYHHSIPVDFFDRLYPLALANAEDLVADEHPVIVVMGGDIGELASLAEGRNNCFPNCVLDDADVQVVKDFIAQAIAERREGAFARINMHIPLVLFDEKNETVLRDFLSMIQGYVDAGEIVWETQGGSYDAYMAMQE